MYTRMSVRVYLFSLNPKIKVWADASKRSSQHLKIIEGHSVGEGQKTRNRVHVLILVWSCSFPARILRKSRTICPCCHSAGPAVWVSTSADIPSMKSGWIAAVSKRPGLQIAPLFSQALGCRAFLVDVKASHNLLSCSAVYHHQTHQQAPFTR